MKSELIYAIRKPDEIKILDTFNKKLDRVEQQFNVELNHIYKNLNKKFDLVEKRTKTKIDKAKKKVTAGLDKQFLVMYYRSREVGK